MSVRKPKILLVDDDVQCLTVRRIMFETFDLKVTICSSPRQALRLFEASRFDAAVIDYQMPEMNGGELALKMMMSRTDVPVVILSGLPYLPDGTPEAQDLFFCKTEPAQKIVREVKALIEASGSGGKGHRMPISQKVLAATGVFVGFAKEGFAQVWQRFLPHRGHAQFKSAHV